jgi:hypothetical protein
MTRHLGGSMVRRWWLAAGVLGVVLAGAALFGYLAVEQAAKVKAELAASRAPLQRASGFAAGSLSERTTLLNEANLHAARARLELGRGPLRVLAYVPFLGRDVRLARAVADAASQTIRSSRQAAGAVERLQQRPLSAGALEQASDALLGLHGALDGGVRDVRAARPLLVGRAERDQFLATAGPASATARRAGDGLHLAAALWGPPGSARYFLAFQNPAELRGTGGLIGEYGVLESSPDGPELSRVASYGELDRSLKSTGGVDPPAGLRLRPDEFRVGKSFFTVNVPADLPTVGRMIVPLYQQAAGTKIDGVIAVDPVALAEILRASGPITVGDRTLDAENIVEETLVRAYVRYADDNEARRRYLQAIARESLAGFRRGLSIQPFELVRGLGAAARGRHIQVYSTDPEVQRTVLELGIGGSAAAPAQGDFLMPVGVNSGANKLDAFLHRSLRYQVRLKADGSAKANAAVTLRNESPASGLPRYVIGPNHPESQAGRNDQLSTLYVAEAYAFTGATVGGRRTPASSQAEFGSLALSQLVGVPAKSSVTFAYDLVRTGALQALPGDRLRYQLTLRPQATVRPDQVGVSVSAPRGWRFVGTSGGARLAGAEATWKGPLDQERVLTLDLARAA